MLHEIAGNLASRQSCGTYEQRRIERYRHGIVERCHDAVVQEVPLLIELDKEIVHRTTCSPWLVVELVLGHLYLEGMIAFLDQVESLELHASGQSYRASVRRNVKLSKRSLAPNLCDSNNRVRLTLSLTEIPRLVSCLEESSVLFHRTGGVHGAALIDGDGVVGRFEDIGRHGVVEKLAGWCLVNRVDPTGMMLLFTGRMPYEIIRKAAKLGIALVLSPGAPTTMSVELAESNDMALVGFAKGERYNMYSRSSRIRLV